MATSNLKFTDVCAIIALILSTGGLIFSAGIVYAQVQAVETRVDHLENNDREQAILLAEIGANTKFLVEQAKEERARR